MFTKLIEDGKETNLYFHRTSGGAEYLFDTFTVCPNGEKEGVINNNTTITIRVDGGELEINRR